MAEHTPQLEEGFELKGRFYRWAVSDMGKDLMLIDRISGMPVVDFFEIIDDEHERTRAPIMLTLIATSIRAANPDWTVDRIVRMVMALSLSEVEFMGAEQDEEPTSPPTQRTEPPTDEPLKSPSNGSSSLLAPKDDSSSETSFVAPA